MKRANEAIRIELEKRKAMDIPSAVYDREKKKIYQLNGVVPGKRLAEECGRGVIVNEKHKNEFLLCMKSK